MQPDELLHSPLASTDSPEAPAQPAPAPQHPEPSRLGILHLMVLTACVAVCMGVMRTIALAAEELPALGSDPFLAAAGTLRGIGGGAALAGLILLVARRLRRIPFPVHPGEYLLVVCAVGAILQLAAQPIYIYMLAGLSGDSSGPPGFLFTIIPLAILCVNAAVFIWALVCVKAWRWRIFLLSIPVCHLAAYGLMILTANTVRPGSMVFMIPSLVPVATSVILLIPVLRDHLDGRRYPWSHWFGVGLRFWFDALRIGSFLRIILTWDASP